MTQSKDTIIINSIDDNGLCEVTMTWTDCTIDFVTVPAGTYIKKMAGLPITDQTMPDGRTVSAAQALKAHLLAYLDAYLRGKAVEIREAKAKKPSLAVKQLVGKSLI